MSSRPQQDFYLIGINRICTLNRIELFFGVIGLDAAVVPNSCGSGRTVEIRKNVFGVVIDSFRHAQLIAAIFRAI